VEIRFLPLPSSPQKIMHNRVVTTDSPFHWSLVSSTTAIWEGKRWMNPGHQFSERVELLSKSTLLERKDSILK
jgi:hypothetical protein